MYERQCDKCTQKNVMKSKWCLKCFVIGNGKTSFFKNKGDMDRIKTNAQKEINRVIKKSEQKEIKTKSFGEVFDKAIEENQTKKAINKTLEICNKESSINNGGETDYYQMPANTKECQDLIEDREMNYAQGCIMKVAFTFNVGRHDGTTYERELNKIIWCAKRELARIKK